MTLKLIKYLSTCEFYKTMKIIKIIKKKSFIDKIINVSVEFIVFLIQI